MRRTCCGFVIVWAMLTAGAVVHAADQTPDEAVTPDLSRTMVIVELSDKYPGQKNTVGHPLERLAAISPREAKITAGLALKDARNRQAMIDGFSAIVEYEKSAREALTDAESKGIGTVVLVTLIQRSIGDIGSSEHRLYVQTTISQHPKAGASWHRLASRKLTTTTDKQRDADDRVVTDCDNMARQVYAMLRQTMTTQTVPVRFKGVRKTTEGVILQLGVVNNAARKITSLTVALPVRDGDPLSLRLNAEVEPEQSTTLAFEPIKHEQAVGVTWTKLQILGIGFAGINPDDQPVNPFENLRERLRLLQ